MRKRARAKKGAEVLTCVLILLTFFLKNIDSSAVTIPIADPRAPCISIEMALPIVKIQNSPPSSLDMSFRFDVKKLYTERYGPNAATSKNHEKTYNCALQVGTEINKLIDSFIMRVIGLIKLRRESYLSDGLNYKTTDKQTTARLKRQNSDGLISSNETSDLFDEERTHLREAIAKTNERWSFDEHWLDDQIRSDLTGGTNSTTFGDINIRNKRDPASVISIIISLIALSAAASSSLFLGARLEKLVDYVDSLSKAVEGDWQSLQVGFKNLILLKDGYGSMAAGAHYMSQTIRRLMNYNLCHIQQTRLFFELRAIANRLDSIFESLVFGKFDTKILPLPLLQEIFTHSSIADDVLSKAVPTTFYQGASLSVLSANKEKQSVRLIFIAPRIEREPSYRVLKIHSVSSTISVNNRIYDRVFNFDVDKIAIPVDLYEKHHSDMMLSAAEVQHLRVPTECTFTNGLFGCRNFLSLPSQISSCLTAIFSRDWHKMLQQCQIKLVPQPQHHRISTSSGSTGMLVSCESTTRIFGLDYQKSTHYQKEELTKMATRDKSSSLCAWVPLHFSKIQFTDSKGNKLDEVEQDTKLLIKNGLVQDIANFETKHFHYTPRILKLDNMSLLNFTGFMSDIESKWGNIGTHNLPVFNMKSTFGYFEIGLAIVVSLILCLYLIKFLRCIRRRIARPTAGEASAARAQITYHAPRSGSPEVTFAIPPESPPHSNPRTNEGENDPRTEPKYHSADPPLAISSACSSDQIEDCRGPPLVQEPIITRLHTGFVGRDSQPPYPGKKTQV